MKKGQVVKVVAGVWTDELAVITGVRAGRVVIQFQNGSLHMYHIDEVEVA
jgi:transcription antitermination factor NusG